MKRWKRWHVTKVESATRVMGCCAGNQILITTDLKMLQMGMIFIFSNKYLKSKKKWPNGYRTEESFLQQRWSSILPCRFNVWGDASQRKSKFERISWKLPCVSFRVNTLLGSSASPILASPPPHLSWKYFPHFGWHGLYRSYLSFNMGSINNHREWKKKKPDMHIHQLAAVIKDAADPIKRPL